MNLTAGTTLQGGKYVLNHPLSQGGLSSTFKATQTDLNKAVVLKTIQPNRQIPIDFLQRKQRFSEVVRQLAQCQHPGLVGILDCFEESGLPFVVMDEVAGQSLAALVQARGRLPEAEALQYVRQVGSALSLLHGQGLVHGDVKPQNLIRPQGADFVVLVDIGMTGNGLLNEEGAAIALPLGAYAAIEQSRWSQKLTPAADVYALAASLYSLVTGQVPVAAPLRQQTPLVPPRQLYPQLSPAVESAILSGLELNPQSRPPSIVAWLNLLPSVPLPVGAESNNGQYPAKPAEVHLPIVGETVNAHNANDVLAQQPLTAANTIAVVSPLATVATHKGSTHKSQQLLPTSQFRLSKPLILVAAIAAALGVGSGLALRVGGATGPGSTIFHTEQAFPPSQNWPGSTGATEDAIGEPPASLSDESQSAPREYVPPEEYIPPEPLPERRIPSRAETGVDDTPAPEPEFVPPAKSSAEAEPEPTSGSQPPVDLAPSEAPVPKAAPEPAPVEPPAAVEAPAPVEPDPVPPAVQPEAETSGAKSETTESSGN